MIKLPELYSDILKSKAIQSFFHVATFILLKKQDIFEASNEASNDFAARNVFLLNLTILPITLSNSGVVFQYEHIFRAPSPESNTIFL